MKGLRAISIVIVALSLGATYASSATQRHAVGPCIAQGAPTEVTGRKTSQYTISYRTVTCAFAKKWVSRLTRKPNVRKGGQFIIVGGPPGFVCRNVGAKPTPTSPNGQCAYKSQSPVKYFSWAPYLS
jgi:hypothetical protein